MSEPSETTPRSFTLDLPRFTLEGGARLPRHEVCGWSWGPTEDSPTVLLVHALTGDARAGGDEGWWAPVIGPGRALDPRHTRLLCFNNLGSCYGTTGPADADFPRRADDARFPAPAPYGKGAHVVDERHLPATVTTWDQARSILLALDHLGVERVDLVAGGSLGGMIALCLAALAPERFARAAVFAAAAAADPWLIGWNHVGRQALLLDPEFPEDVSRGLELARQLAHMTYRAAPGLDAHQGRRMGRDAARERDGRPWSTRGAYRVQTYLEHQGRKLRRRFHGGAYLAQLDAMDHHDLGRSPPVPEPCESWTAVGPTPTWREDEHLLARIRAATLAIAIDTDALFQPRHMVTLAAKLVAHGAHAETATLESPHGHDAFLIEWDQVEALLRRALALPAFGRREAPVSPTDLDSDKTIDRRDNPWPVRSVGS